VGRDVIQVNFYDAFGKRRAHPNLCVIASSYRSVGATVDGEWQYEALVVVGVLANQVYATRGRPNSCRLVSKCCLKRGLSVFGDAVRH
jgi:hypothetical protein